MPATRTNVDYAKRIFRARLGNPYVYAEEWSRTDERRGCDCSALVAHICNAVVYGTGMQWRRIDPASGAWITTESWRPVEVGERGPFGTVTVDGPDGFPRDAAVKVCLHHGEGGGVNSHMNCEVDGVLMESSGDYGCCTNGTGAIPTTSDYWNDWAYLPGPVIADAGVPASPLTDSQKLDVLFTEFSKLFASRSPYRTDDRRFETAVGFVLNSDRMKHMEMVEDAALAGEEWAVDLVNKLASGADDHPGCWLWYPDAQGKPKKDKWAIAHAKDVQKRLK